MRKISVLILALALCITAFAGCGNDETGSDITRTDLYASEYEGIWVCEEIDAAIVLSAYGDNTYGEWERYVIAVGQEPVHTSGGLFVTDGPSYIHFGDGTDRDDFEALDEYTDIHSPDSTTIVVLGYDFTKHTDDPDPAYLDELTMPMADAADYVGEWESDTVYVKLNISEDGFVIYNADGSVTSGSITSKRGCLQLGLTEDNMLLYLTDDGILKLNTLDGFFYPLGSGHGAPSPYLALAGIWDNATTGESITINEEGTYARSYAGGFAAGSVSLSGDQIIIGDWVCEVSGDEMTVEGVEGVFVKQ